MGQSWHLKYEMMMATPPHRSHTIRAIGLKYAAPATNKTTKEDEDLRYSCIKDNSFSTDKATANSPSESVLILPYLKYKLYPFYELITKGLFHLGRSCPEINPEIL